MHGLHTMNIDEDKELGPLHHGSSPGLQTVLAETLILAGRLDPRKNTRHIRPTVCIPSSGTGRISRYGACFFNDSVILSRNRGIVKWVVTPEDQKVLCNFPKIESIEIFPNARE